MTIVNRPEALLTELGGGRLFHGSSTKMRQLPDSSVALVVTSPPYFVGKEYELAVTGEFDSESRVPGT
jgi:DNA modification methylase